MSTPFSRRSFLAMSAMLPLSLRAFAASSVPVGLELYSVRNALKDDPMGTVRTVAQMGYQVVEFYAPYFDWTEPQTREMKKLMDDLGVRCHSTHNSSSYFTTENLKKAQDRNLILGSTYVVMSSSEPKPGLDGWKEVADTLNSADDQLKKAGLKTGYHNHELEFTPVRWQTSDRNTGEEYKVIGGPAARRRNLSQGGLGPGSVDSRQSRANQIHPLQRLGAGSGQGLHRIIWRRLCGLEGYFRGCGKCWRRGILPNRTGRQPFLRIRHRQALPRNISQPAPRVRVAPASRRPDGRARPAGFAA